MSPSLLPPRLHTLFLTDPGMLSAVFGPRVTPGRMADALRRQTRLAFHVDQPALPEHQRIHLMAEFFDGENSHAALLLKALDELAESLFIWEDGQLRFTDQGVLLWVEGLGAHISTMPLMAAAVARNVRKGLQDVASLKHVFAGPLLPLPCEKHVASLLKKGLVEIHMHLSNSAPEVLVWLEALRRPWDALQEPLRQSEDPEHIHLWEAVLPGHSPQDVHSLLRLAFALREWLVSWCKDGGSLECAAPLMEGAPTSFGLAVQPPQPALGLYEIHPAELLPGFGSSPPAMAEGAFWVSALLRLKKERCPYAARMLHAYLLIHSMFLRLIVHQEGLKGFDLFETLAQNSVRDKVEGGLQGQCLQQLAHCGSLKGLEGRLAAKNSATELLQKVMKWTKTLDDEGRFTTANRQCRLGIHCHFIKEEDKERKNEARRAPQETAPFLACRHARLRERLVFQAMALRTMRDHYPKEGGRLLAIDGANNELKTPPEVFAPIFRELRYQFSQKPQPLAAEFSALQDAPPPPPLRYLFHAGEEFRHLLSGLRAIDEAIDFLDLPPGSRLGHCLALGFEPEWWLDRLPEVRLPRLEWLDNLVWLHRHMQEDADFKLHLHEQIQMLSLEVYGVSHPSQLLHQAWRLRMLGMTPYEMALPSQVYLRNQLDREILPAAFDIYEEYHFSRNVWKKGEEVIEAGMYGRPKRQWVAALRNAQKRLLHKLDQRGLAIEACPSSNLRISQLENLKQHPVFHWRLVQEEPGQQDPYVLLATDNPGFCQTSLALEYAAMSIRAREMKDDLSSRQMQSWLDRFYEDTERWTMLGRMPG